jgi:hypothetical protein
MRAQLLIVSCCLILAGCNKKNTPEYVQCYPLMPSPHLVAEERLYGGPDTTYLGSWFFIYDETGRLIFKLSSQGGTPDTVERYTYFSDKILMNASEYILNGQGLATSLNNSKTWKYNVEGYLTEETGTYQKGIYSCMYNYTCYNAEQVITRKQTTPGVYTDTAYYQHYSDKANTIGNENHGIHFLGRQDNTLLKSRVDHGQTMDSYTYVFDSMNRVLWEVQTNNFGIVTYRKFLYL